MGRVKQLLAGVLAGLLLVNGGVTPALAAGGSVEYHGGAEGFFVEPPENLFAAIKGLMPGDTVTEEIALGNRCGQRCALYLSARGEPADAELLGLLQLRLALRTQGGQELLLYEGSAAGGPQGQVHLGDYNSGRGATLVATLTVPATLENRWQNATGRLHWVFEAVQLGGGNGGGDVLVEQPTDLTLAKAPTAVLPATGRQAA